MRRNPDTSRPIGNNPTPPHRISETKEPRIPAFITIKDDEGEVIAVVPEGIGERDERLYDCGD